MPPTSLYLHIPFCMRKCSYCDFASQIYEGGLADAYLEAMGRELLQRAHKATPRTIYIGGGTPTTLTTKQWARLLDLLKRIDLSQVVEFTVEANPGTLEMEKLILLHDEGVDRLSFGAQTFHPEGLRVLDRVHTARQTRAAIAQAREAGFDNISLDLIYGWPGQKPGDWFDDVHEAVRLAPEHLSCYGLTFEPGTALDRHRQTGALHLVSEEDDRAMFDLIGSYLPGKGYRRYEVSSLALPGHECRHNLVYWEGGEYIGIGTAAHSYEGGKRSSNCRDLAEYTRRIDHGESPCDWSEELTPDRAARERVVIGLRLLDGLDPHTFHDQTGFALDDALLEDLPKLIDDGWLEWLDGRLRLTDKALPVADSVLADLVG